MMKKNILDTNWQMLLNDWSVLKVTGTDSVAFLNRQTTNDIKNLERNKAILSARLTVHGKLQSFFYVAKKDEGLFLFADKILAESIKNELHKFIIMDDVQIEIENINLWFVANHFLIKNLNFEKIEASYMGISGLFLFNKVENIEEIKSEDLEVIRKLNGHPKWNVEVSNKDFINETLLNEMAISYTKGCFLGHETVSKIENNRGASHYPILIMLDELTDFNFENKEIKFDNLVIGTVLKITSFNNKTYLHTTLVREYRLYDLNIKFQIDQISFEGKILKYPLFKQHTSETLAQHYYENGINLFKNNQSIEAILNLDISINLHPTADAYEMKGVMLSRSEKFEEAILCMDQLLSLDSSSVMAHTNKSLYLMRLGQIEKAEEEKSLATVKTFELLGKEASLKKIERKRLEEEKNEQLRREAMFNKVLEIDADDDIANFGLGEIYFNKKEYKLAYTYLKKSVEINPKNAKAKLLLQKADSALQL